MKVIGIYHSRDLDGITSGAIIKRKFPDAKLIGYDYGESTTKIFNELLRDSGDTEFIMADVSLPMVLMKQIGSMCNGQFTWIDHHISAINDYKAVTKDFSKEEHRNFLHPVLDNTISACEGVWKYLFPKEEMPKSVLLLGEYDTFRIKGSRYENEILPFQYGMRGKCNSIDTFPMYLLDSDNRNEDIENIIHDGKTILSYQAKINESNCKKSFEAKFEGYTAICLNASNCSTDIFKNVYNPNKHDLMMPFYYDGNSGQWNLSIYTTKNIDCSTLAKKHGGGGHMKASGFTTYSMSNVFKIFLHDEWIKTEDKLPPIRKC